MGTVEDFILDREGDQREIMQFLHNFLTGVNLRGKISYQIPFYYNRSWVCYLNPVPEGKVELAFPRGNELSNDQGILMSNGRKQVKGVILEKTSDIPLEKIKEIVNEAILLDETVPYSFKHPSSEKTT
jgi:hypothetical protein